jgi:hypothetical protein
MRRFAVVLIYLSLLTSCKSGDVYRPRDKNNLTQYVVVARTIFSEKGKTELIRFKFNLTSGRWEEDGDTQTVPESEVGKILENYRQYQGDPNLPPSNGAVARPPANIYLLSNYGNSAVIALNSTTLAETTRFPSATNISDIDASPDGFRVAILTPRELRILDTTTNTVTRTVALPTGGSALKVHYSPDGALLYVVDGARGVYIINTTTFALERTIAFPTGITSASNSFLSPDGDTLLIATSGSSGTTILDTSSLLWSTTNSLSIFSTTPCAFHPNGHELYCGTATGVSIINTSTLTSTLVRTSAVEVPLQVHFLENGDFFVFTTDKTIRIYNTPTRTINTTITPVAGKIFNGSFTLSTL